MRTKFGRRQHALDFRTIHQFPAKKHSDIVINIRRQNLIRNVSCREYGKNGD